MTADYRYKGLVLLPNVRRRAGNSLVPNALIIPNINLDNTTEPEVGSLHFSFTSSSSTRAFLSLS